MANPYAGAQAPTDCRREAITTEALEALCSISEEAAELCLALDKAVNGRLTTTYSRAYDSGYE